VHHDAESPPPAVVEHARHEDLPAVFALLEKNGLPLDGLADHLPTTLVVRQDGQIVAVAALELYSGTALLRSVAVDPQAQGRGLGHRLTEAALRDAEARRVGDVFLLTTTAERFFPRFGFETVAREVVPPAVRSSVEFTSACPASAIVMRKRLTRAR
jgi:amino-acid N-acetyltransferase